MRTKSKRLIMQSNISLGRCFAASIMASIISNALAFVHAGLSVVNIIRAIALCVIYFKFSRTKRFQKFTSAIYLILITVFNLPSILMSALLVFSFALCFVGRLDWNELAATL